MISEEDADFEGRAFSKCDGLGNDFIVLWRHPNESPVSPEDARRLCHRKSGVIARENGGETIGADGILELSEPWEQSGDSCVHMRILNADGSEAQMCGNGLRCAAIYLVNSCHVPRGTLPPEGAFVVETAAGIRRAKILSLSKKMVAQTGKEASSVAFEAVVEASMGCAVLKASKIPLRLPDEAAPSALGDGRNAPPVDFIQKPLTVSLPNGTTKEVIGTAVSMGNPHFVLVCPTDISEDDFKVLAPRLQSHEVFPEGVNVELLLRDETASDGTVAFKMVVLERGAGWTKACGTGACACAVALCLAGETSFGELIEIRMPGGAVEVCVDAETLDVRLVGPARHTFEGTFNLTCRTS